MKTRFLIVFGVVLLMALAATTAWAAPVPGNLSESPAAEASPAGTTTMNINIVFVGYETGDINMTKFKAELPAKYDPIVRYPNFYGINLPVNVHAKYAFNYVFAPSSFEDAFFGYLNSIGAPGPLTAFQTQYNSQVHKSLTISGDVLYIDGPSTEQWLMNHGRSDLGLDVGNYTVFFVNWHSRSDFKYHVYTKTSFADPDTGYNFGMLRGSRKMIAWGGTYGRTWFYDLSAGPESWTANWDVDDADVDGDSVLDYRMPPVWEYGNLTGYRPFDNLSGDLGKVTRWVAIDLLFTSSPLYDPLASEPYPGKGKTVDINIFEDVKNGDGLNWLHTDYVLDALSMFEPQYPWKVKVADQNLNGGAKKAFRQWAEINLADGCWNSYGTRGAELFCYFDANRNQYLNPIKPVQNYIGGIFAFNTRINRMGVNGGLLGFADDDWMSGTPSYVFAFDTAYYRSLGYGFSTTVVHEFGHHIGMSHPHDGYDSTSGIDFGPTGDYYFAWSGDESETIMSYIDLTGTFGQFDHDNMSRFLTGRFITRAAEIAAQVSKADPSGSRALLESATRSMDEARAAYSQNDWARAASLARDAFTSAYRASENAGLNLPITAPLTGGGPFRGTKPVDPVHPPRYQ